MMRKLQLTLLLSGALMLPAHSQICGCTDTYATNYTQGATINNGSCLYEPTSQTPVYKSTLSLDLSETSGLTYFNNKYWTHNDSGNLNRIYQFNPQSGQIERSVVIKNATNIDWECMAQSSSYLFIGDCGNNATGARKDLCILKISKAAIANNKNDTVTAEKIYFSYPDQTNFTPSQNATNFDCEAIIFDNDSIHLFTKNWVDKKCTHYRVPSTPGTFVAKNVETFNPNGLITDADFTSVNGNIVLIGYQEIVMGYYVCFAWLLFDYQPGHYFSGNKRRIDLGPATQIGQTEGVLLFDDGSGYISNERVESPIVTIPASLRGFDFNSYYHNLADGFKEITKEISVISKSYLNPDTNHLNITINHPHNNIRASLYDVFGKKATAWNLSNGENSTDLSMLQNGLYIVKLDQFPNSAIKIIKR